MSVQSYTAASDENATESPTSLKFHITKDEGCRGVPVSGAWGAVTPQGDTFMDVYHMAEALPNEITQQVSPDGALGDVLQQSTAFGLQRNVRVGMVLNEEPADRMGRWLREMADQARKIRAADLTPAHPRRPAVVKPRLDSGFQPNRGLPIAEFRTVWLRNPGGRYS